MNNNGSLNQLTKGLKYDHKTYYVGRILVVVDTMF